MDSGAAIRHSCRLAGLSPSTTPLPLGERNRLSGWTTYHIDSHMMADHKDEILLMGICDYARNGGKQPKPRSLKQAPSCLGWLFLTGLKALLA